MICPGNGEALIAGNFDVLLEGDCENRLVTRDSGGAMYISNPLVLLKLAERVVGFVGELEGLEFNDSDAVGDFDGVDVCVNSEGFNVRTEVATGVPVGGIVCIGVVEESCEAV